jgi:hypothetical protein
MDAVIAYVQTLTATPVTHENVFYLLHECTGQDCHFPDEVVLPVTATAAASTSQYIEEEEDKAFLAAVADLDSRLAHLRSDSIGTYTDPSHRLFLRNPTSLQLLSFYGDHSRDSSQGTTTVSGL